MAAQTYPKVLYAGLQANYEAIETPDSSVLYFCTDSGKIYKGSVDFTANVLFAANEAAVTTPIVGKLYVMTTAGTCEVYNGSAWTVVSYPKVDVVDADSDASHVASAKAVWDAIQDAVSDLAGSGSVVKSVAASSTSAATLVVTIGNGEETEVLVPGVVTTPTYDAEERIITIPVTGADPVVINIGKDIYVNPDAPNGYDSTTGDIILYLAPGEFTDGVEDTDHYTGQVIRVPASGLIDVYTGATANGTSTTVSDDNKISVALVLDPDGAPELTIGEAGIKLDLSAYAKSSDLTDLTDALDSRVGALEDTVNGTDEAEGLTSKVATLTADASTEGSVAYQVAQLKTNYVDVNTSDIADLKGSLDNLAEATTVWGTF